MKIKNLLLGFLLISGSLFAQEIEYSFEQFSSQYSDLTSPISINNGEIWDDPEYVVPLDFEFKLFNSTISALTFIDGFGADLFSVDSTKAIWTITADITDRAYLEDDEGENLGELGSSSPISYINEGEPGERIFKLQWKNAGFYEDEDKDYFINFQLWLFETTDMIEIHFGPSEVPNSFFIEEENLVGFFKKNNNNPPPFGYILNEYTGGYQFATSYLDFNFSPAYFNSIPKEGTVFRFYPEYAVGIEKLELGFKTYPNPVKDLLYIDNYDNVLLHCEIINLQGEIIQQFASIERTVIIDCSEFSSGTYFLKIFVDDQVITKSIIKQ